MKLTSHEEYGLRCLLRLAQEGPGGTLTIPEISQAEGISEAYVGKLQRMLRLGGFVTAARGTGGYSLARPASQIALGEVTAVLGGHLFEGGFIQAKLAIAEIETKAQNVSERLAFVEEFIKQQHSQAHEAGMQAQDHAHERGLAKQLAGSRFDVASGRSSAPDGHGARSAAPSGLSNGGGASG